MRGAALVAACLLAASRPACATDPGLVALFDRFCLTRFPAAETAEGAPDMDAMAPAQVREFLHDDPGRGWFVDEGDAHYALTLEEPPYKACAIRRVYDRPPDLISDWVARSKDWARRVGRGPFGARQPMTVTRNGTPITATLMTLPATATAGKEVFMALTTRNTDGTTELRLVRQIPDVSVGG